MCQCLDNINLFPISKEQYYNEKGIKSLSIGVIQGGYFISKQSY